jgi:RHS repeat-associated protein
MCSCDNTDTFTYDDQELLSQVRYGAGGSSTMTWDADQQRQKLTNSGGSTYFVYDPTAGVPAVLVETDGENETFYVREPGGELIARATGQTRQYYLFDRLGSTIAMVPAVEGNPTDRLFYTPWGELVTSGSRASTVGTTANPYRYVGQLGYYYHHQDAGLQDWMQLGVRFYEPEIGRFERRDPVESEPEYIYCGSLCMRLVDPSGALAGRYTLCASLCPGHGSAGRFACRACKAATDRFCKGIGGALCCYGDKKACHENCEKCKNRDAFENCWARCDTLYAACLINNSAFE